MLEVKVATPREEMKPPAKKITRVFVARIPPIVTDEMFRSYFEKYGALTDAYMPKDLASKAHRGIGFVTYEHPGTV
jgi:RNA-binding protein Musashi